MTKRKFINLVGHICIWVLKFYLCLSVVCGHFRNFGISDWLTHLHHWNHRYFWNDWTLWSRMPNTLVCPLHLELTPESQEFLQKDLKAMFCKGSGKIQSGFCWSVLGLAEFRVFSGRVARFCHASMLMGCLLGIPFWLVDLLFNTNRNGMNGSSGWCCGAGPRRHPSHCHGRPPCGGRFHVSNTQHLKRHPPKLQVACGQTHLAQKIRES